MSFLELLYFIIPVTIAYAAPLIFTAIGGVFSERSGVVNIGLEGLMVMGAFIGILFTFFLRHVWCMDPLACTSCRDGCLRIILNHACSSIDNVSSGPSCIRCSH